MARSLPLQRRKRCRSTKQYSFQIYNDYSIYYKHDYLANSGSIINNFKWTLIIRVMPKAAFTDHAYLRAEIRMISFSMQLQKTKKSKMHAVK